MFYMRGGSNRSNKGGVGEMKAIDGIDWKLLREQKMHLLSAIDNASNYGDGGNEYQGLLGILHLIDAIQDEMAEDLGEEAVFGLPREEMNYNRR